MSSSPNAQHEPTMEEILASIRKIISEDQPDPSKAAPAAAPAPAPAAAPTPVRNALENAAQTEADVLELTDEVREEQPEPPPAPPPAPPLENDIAFENIEAEPEPEPMDDLISDATRSAVGRAFSGLGREKDFSAPPSATGNSLEALFLRAIHDAFTPVLQEWVDSHYDEILERMKPMIREWMDDNLPALIEATVTREIRAAAPPRGRRR
jgi:cell pole-organizing protein PopZ